LTLAFNVEGDDLAVGEGDGLVAEVGNAADGVAVDFVNDVALEEAVVFGGEIEDDAGDDGTAKATEWAEDAGYFFVEVDGEDAELGDARRFALNEANDAVGVAGAFEDGNAFFEFLAGAEDFEGDGLAGLAVDVNADLAGVFDSFAVEREDDVLGFEARGSGGTVVGDVGDDGSPVARQLERFGQGGRDGLGNDADLAASNPTEFANLFIHGADDVGRGGEADAFVATALGQDEGVDANEVAVGVDEGSAAVAGIDGGVGLEVDHGVIGPDLTGDGADDAHGDRIFEAEGAAEGEDDLALADFVGIAEGEGGELGTGDFKDGDIGFAVESDELGGDEFAGGLEEAVARSGVFRGLRKEDLNATGSADDVGVGENVASGVDNDAAAAATGGAEEIAGAFGGGAEAACDDLDDGGVDLVDEIFKLAAQTAERGGGLAEERQREGEEEKDSDHRLNGRQFVSELFEF